MCWQRLDIYHHQVQVRQRYRSFMFLLFILRRGFLRGFVALRLIDDIRTKRTSLRRDDLLPATFSSPHCATMGNSGDCCWICKEAFGDRDSSIFACTCARVAHKACLSKWQMNKAGLKEETMCGFCGNELPDWRAGVFADLLSVPKQVPAIRVNINEKGYLIEARPGQEGMAMFQASVKKLCKVDGSSDFNVGFECRMPDPADRSGPPLELKGLPAYEALCHIAKLRAASANDVSSAPEAKIDLFFPEGYQKTPQGAGGIVASAVRKVIARVTGHVVTGL